MLRICMRETDAKDVSLYVLSAEPSYICRRSFIHFTHDEFLVRLTKAFLGGRGWKWYANSYIARYLCNSNGKHWIFSKEIAEEMKQMGGRVMKGCGCITFSVSQHNAQPCTCTSLYSRRWWMNEVDYSTGLITPTSLLLITGEMVGWAQS